MNATIISLTFRRMIGRRPQALVMAVLPVALLTLAIVLKATDNADLETSTEVLHSFGLGALLPLLALLAGTGVIAPEIDDGQIMYVMTKPIGRPVITNSKLVVAVVLVSVWGVLPILAAGLIMSGGTAGLAVAFTVGALAGGIAYCALFLALAVFSRHAVATGLIYALIWEGLVGNFAPGAKRLSIQQWALSVADSLSSASSLDAPVKIAIAVPMLIIVSLGGAALAGLRLRSMAIAGASD